MNARDESALEAAAATLRSEGFTVHCRPFDVCDTAAVSAAVDSIESEIGPVDILVNNAGLQIRGAMLDYDVDDFRQLIEVNLVAAFTVGKAVAGRMVPRRPRQDHQHLFGHVDGRPADRDGVHLDEGCVEDADPGDVRRASVRSASRSTALVPDTSPPS